jgi:hypothetical protein
MDDPIQEIALVATAEEEEPARRRYVINDATVEKLGEILSDNPNGIMVVRDELTGLFKSLDRDGHESDRAFILECWNGNGSFTWDRIGRGTVEIPAACMSIIGNIQPGPFSYYLSRIFRGGADDDGLLQRFQLAVWPDAPGQWVNHDREPDAEARMTAKEVFDNLATIDPDDLGAKSEDNTIPFLRFTADAQELWIEWRTKLEYRIRNDLESPLLEAHLAKYRSLVPSLALLIHLADVGNGPVGKAALERACQWAKYLESHARRIYAPALFTASNTANELGLRLQRGELDDGFTVRELYNKGWHGLTSREEVQEAIDLLEDLHWLRGTREKTGGRPSVKYAINPRIKENAQ